MKTLAVYNLQKSYKDKVVLDGLNFEVSKGEAISIIGSNGAGKSTLIKCILFLTKPDSGSIDIFENRVNNLSQSILRKLRSKVGVVFQKHNLVPRLSVLSNVIHGAIGEANSSSMFPLSAVSRWTHVTASSSIRSKAVDCLKMVGLESLALKRADSLSGGQSQRVAIARALMQNPEIIIADEPAASLDPVAGQQVMDLFFKLCKEQNITLLFTSHNTDQALDYADRTIALKNGKISLNEKTNMLKSKDLISEYG